MPNMLDYLAWRGDLTIKQDPLNENDELILSQLAYVAFGDYLPAPDKPDARVSIHDATSWLLSHDPEAEKIHQTGFMWKNNLQLLEAIRDTRRFGDMPLFFAVDTVSSEDEKQFAAMAVEIGDGTTLASFRGTDDTLIGWKEDLSMAFASPVPAQRESTRYLDTLASVTSGPLRVSGHSKGGNLAVYAASRCAAETQERLMTVISHDGPGLDKGTIHSDGYARIRDRLRVYIPYFSVVGMLLEHEDRYTVVQSDAKSILQHDAFSWQMHGTRMMQAPAPSEGSLNTNRILRQWIETLNAQEQQLFVEAVYEIACASYGNTIPDDLEQSWPYSVHSILTAVFKLDSQTRAQFTKGLTELFSTALKNIRLPWHKDTDKRPDSLPEAANPAPRATDG